MSVLEQQLVAARETAKALVASIDAALGALQVKPACDGTCHHPPEQRIAAPRMGQPEAYVCGKCGAEGG